MIIMLTMNTIDLRRIDLNLLVVFQAIMHEGGVTRAAVRLHLGQSAVSAALARLRAVFDDPLFERSRAGMRPTPRALEISRALDPSLASIASIVFESPEFDPATSTRALHLAMSDDLAVTFAPWFARRRIAEGWSIEVGIHQTNSSLWRESLERDDIDVVLAVAPDRDGATYRSAALFSGGYLCLYDPRLVDVSDPVTFDEYVATPHVRVSYDVQRGWVDELLAASGRTRPTVCSISHFSGLPPILSEVPAIATIPEHAARGLAGVTGLAVSAVPMRAPRFTISALWSTDSDGAPENVWLRGLLSDFAATV